MSGTISSGSSFATHVHEVVDLDEHGASLGTVEASIESMGLGVEEQSALRLLASSLHAGPNVNQLVGPTTAKWSWHEDLPEVER